MAQTVESACSAGDPSSIPGSGRFLSTCFKMYPGLVLIRYDETHRQGHDCPRRRGSYTHSSLETGGMTHAVGLYGEAPGLVRRQKGQRKTRAGACTVFLWERQGRVNRLRIGWYESFQQPSAGIRAISCCLAPGPGVIRAVAWPAGVSQIEEVIQSIGSELVCPG